MRPSDFADIVIVDLDVAKTTWSRVHSSMRTVYLQLSREPNVAWTRHFLEEREKRINPKRHGLWIEDHYIVIDCLIHEVESHHLPDVHKSVAYANRKCREHIDSHRETAEDAREDARSEQEKLAALRARIRADAPAVADSSAAKANGRNAHTTNSAAAPPQEAAASALATKRGDWQARFRAALASRKKESERGND